MSKGKTLADKCRAYLDRRWKSVCRDIERGVFGEPLSGCEHGLKPLVRDCLTSKTKSYHYVLPTQVLCKCVDPSLDCHSLQSAYARAGAFDARSVVHMVVVPFDQSNHKVLGGSSEPYVNNPLRCPAVTSEYRAQQKNKEDWDKLTAVQDAVQEASSPAFAKQLFDHILAQIYAQLSEVTVVYPIPNRISLEATSRLLTRFTGEKSGGDRVEAVCAALFQAVADRFRLFDRIRRQKVNAADASTGMSADIECWFGDKIVLLVEVKDRSLTLTQLDAKLDVARARRISEILFLAEGGIEKAKIRQTERRIAAEFTSGQNVYVSSFADFATGILILLGEKGRAAFLALVGDQLDRANSAIPHRRAWADLLKSV